MYYSGLGSWRVHWQWTKQQMLHSESTKGKIISASWRPNRQSMSIAVECGEIVLQSSGQDPTTKYYSDCLSVSPLCNRGIIATRFAFLTYLFLTFITVTHLTTSNCNSNPTPLHTLECWILPKEHTTTTTLSNDECLYRATPPHKQCLIKKGGAKH